MRRLVLAIALSVTVPALVAAPRAALAWEQDGVSKATHVSIMKCDVDTRRVVSGGDGDVVGSLDAAIDAIDADLGQASGKTAAKLRGWKDILEDGKASLNGKRGDARIKALRALRKKMAPMVEEAKAASK